jgi:hypothetical protein
VFEPVVLFVEVVAFIGAVVFVIILVDSFHEEHNQMHN